MVPRSAHPPLQERDEGVSLLVDAARAVTPDTGGRMFVVEGPPGIGKTRLLAEVRERLRQDGRSVVRALGSPLEREFAYGVARQLFEPMLTAEAELGRGPLFAGAAAQAASVFTVEAIRPVGDLAVLHGLYWLVVNACTAEPLTLVVDDVQYADSPSLRLLAYLLPRLDGLPLTVMLALTSGAPVPDLLAEILRTPSTEFVRLRPLGPTGTAAVLATMFGTRPDDAFVAACHDSSGGNPLLLTELARGCVEQGIAPTSGNATLLATVLLPCRIRPHLGSMPQDVVDVAHAVALLGNEADLPAISAVSGLGVEAAATAVDRLIRSHVLARAPGGRFGYPHQLLQRSAYEYLDTPRRIRGHRAAALHLAAMGAEPERIAAQILQVPPGVVPGAAGYLRRAAETALFRGSPDSAYTYLRRALPEATGDEDRQVLVDQLADVALHSDVEAAARYGEQALASAVEPAARAAAGLRLGEALLLGGDTEAAIRAWRDARQALGEASPPGDAGRRRHLDAYLVNVTVLEPGQLHLLDEVGQAAGDDEPPSAGGRALDCVLALRAAFEARPQAAPAARRGLSDGLLVRLGTGDSPLVCGWLALLAAEDELAGTSIDHARREAYRRGSVRAYGPAHALAALHELWRGNLAEAEREARTAVEAVERSGVRLGRPFVAPFLADILAERGDLAGARSALAWAGLPEEPPPAGPMYFYADTRARLLRRTVGGERAVAAALDAGRLFARFGGDNPAFVPWRTEAARTLHRLGHGDQAAELALAEVALARRWGAPRPLGRALRVAGVVLGAQDGFPLLAEAVDVLAGSPARLEYAKALVDLAAAADRRGRRGWARELLDDAAELAAQCDCPPLRERVDAMSGAAGSRTASAGPGATALTSTERRVAELAATGMSNREIAETLFVAPKTVELHLTNTYRKLRIGGRVELVHALDRVAAGTARPPRARR
ncbi:ATP-binding protein [Microbispora triticiradicis]|uniref:ATP-binding protein n=1 Tax=Microbispora triticiradicis TaxID=2200763 RepID=UPI001AD67EFC|nr:LuxR family transcriptional regulator [Microbispora triticiradicis]MBO4269507.1 AAA family ATPase [Microbispora triticiradicis]